MDDDDYYCRAHGRRNCAPCEVAYAERAAREQIERERKHREERIIALLEAIARKMGAIPAERDDTKEE